MNLRSGWARHLRRICDSNHGQRSGLGSVLATGVSTLQVEASTMIGEAPRSRFGLERCIDQGQGGLVEPASAAGFFAKCVEFIERADGAVRRAFAGVCGVGPYARFLGGARFGELSEPSGVGSSAVRRSGARERDSTSARCSASLGSTRSSSATSIRRIASTARQAFSIVSPAAGRRAAASP